MPFGKDKPITVGGFGVFRVIPHNGEEESRHDVGSRTATGGMAAAGLARRSNAFDTQVRCFVLQRG